jgi:WhiB family redox-sensing transcriptional regulator
MLPPLVSEKWNWRLRAACRGDHVNRYFNDDKERGPTKRARDASAKAVCANCPVIGACLDWALSVGEAYGVWGGATPSERADLTKASLSKTVLLSHDQTRVAPVLPALFVA